MSLFTENLIVSPLPDGRRWVLRKAFSYDVGEEGSGKKIMVPIGFITDFASVPRLFWRLFPKWGKYGNAAVIHDYLYWEQPCSKAMSDLIFYEGMLVLGAGKFTSQILYWCVKYFGYRAWGNNKKAKAKGMKKYIEPDGKEIFIPGIKL